MTITHINYTAANVNMGNECTPQDADAFRAWAITQINARYPDAQCTVSNSINPTEIVCSEYDDGDIETEAQEFCAGLWDACPWDFEN